MQGRLKLGTRGSPLALAQARKVAAAIETSQRWPDGYIEIVPIKTIGDEVQDRPLSEIGGKGLWTKQLDEALTAGDVHFCVHSMKDVESVRPKAIHIAAVRPRGDVRDRIVGAESIDELKERAFTRALGASCAAPVACFAVLEDGDLRMRAQLFAEDGSEMIEDRAVFDCGDVRTPADLARDMLARAPESVRRLFPAG